MISFSLRQLHSQTKSPPPLPPGTHITGGWVGLTAGLHVFEKEISVIVSTTSLFYLTTIVCHFAALVNGRLSVTTDTCEIKLWSYAGPRYVVHRWSFRRSTYRRPASSPCSVLSLQNAASLPLPVGASCSACRGFVPGSSSLSLHRHLCHFGGAPECKLHFDAPFKLPPHTSATTNTSQSVGQFVWNSRSLSYRQSCRRQEHYDVVSTLCTRCQCC